VSGPGARRPQGRAGFTLWLPLVFHHRRLNPRKTAWFETLTAFAPHQHGFPRVPEEPRPAWRLEGRGSVQNAEPVRARGRAGFTLLEVMVALMILATSLVILLGNHSYSIRLSGIARNLSIASMIAKDMMTQVELEGFPEIGESEGDFEDKYPGFWWHMDVQESFFNDVREVHLEILWGDTETPERLELVNFLAGYQYDEAEGTAPGGDDDSSSSGSGGGTGTSGTSGSGGGGK